MISPKHRVMLTLAAAIFVLAVAVWFLGSRSVQVEEAPARVPAPLDVVPRSPSWGTPSRRAALGKDTKWATEWCVVDGELPEGTKVYWEEPWPWVKFPGALREVRREQGVSGFSLPSMGRPPRHSHGILVVAPGRPAVRFQVESGFCSIVPPQEAALGVLRGQVEPLTSHSLWVDACGRRIVPEPDGTFQINLPPGLCRVVARRGDGLQRVVESPPVVATIPEDGSVDVRLSLPPEDDIGDPGFKLDLPTMMVNFVFTDCFPDGGGPEIGDTLASINGTPIGDLTDEEVLFRLTGPIGSSVGVRFADGPPLSLRRCGREAAASADPEATRLDLLRQMDALKEHGLISDEVHRASVGRLQRPDWQDPESYRRSAPAPEE